MKHEHIALDPAVRAGKPCIKGTRITVEQVLREISAGLTIGEILDAHPHLTPDDIYAAVAYAADVIAHEDIILSGPHNALPV